VSIPLAVWITRGVTLDDTVTLYLALGIGQEAGQDIFVLLQLAS